MDTMVKPISLGALEGGLDRPLALLDVAGDVLQHHDGVVDDEADRDRERHQRQIVEGVAERPTSARRRRAAPAARSRSG